MQLYAQDHKGTRVFVEQAEKARNYFCLECQKELRLRGGLHVQLHFYHIEKNGACRQNGKTEQHLLLQQRFLYAFPMAKLEYPFSEIGRIADVALLDEKIIIEVQCSPMAAEEMRERVRDYARMGFQVIWILSDSTFLKRRVSAFEMALHDFPHYYARGVEVYDAYSLIHRGLRVEQAITKNVNIDRLAERKRGSCEGELPSAMKKRHEKWLYHFEGDFLDERDEFFGEYVEKERARQPVKAPFSVRRYLKTLYRAMLAGSCR
jgi:competence protein CoiA